MEIQRIGKSYVCMLQEQQMQDNGCVCKMGDGGNLACFARCCKVCIVCMIACGLAFLALRLDA